MADQTRLEQEHRGMDPRHQVWLRLEAPVRVAATFQMLGPPRGLRELPFGTTLP